MVSLVRPLGINHDDRIGFALMVAHVLSFDEFYWKFFQGLLLGNLLGLLLACSFENHVFAAKRYYLLRSLNLMILLS